MILAGDEARHLLHHRHRGAEAPEYLRELESDIASSNDDEALRQGVQFEQRRVVERPDLIAAGEIGRLGAAADVDEEAFGLERVVADPECGWRQEARLAFDDGATGKAAEPGLEV